MAETMLSITFATMDDARYFYDCAKSLRWVSNEPVLSPVRVDSGYPPEQQPYAGIKATFEKHPGDETDYQALAARLTATKP